MVGPFLTVDLVVLSTFDGRSKHFLTRVLEGEDFGGWHDTTHFLPVAKLAPGYPFVHKTSQGM